ncbi:MAG: beta-glucosidase [Deltaproteobacteria bacterium]|nr:beta-glucosidase [Deltaproteobacteria bacterium]
MGHHPFPPGFLWGVATSAFQIEGATRDGGRGESVWDRFCTQPGAISDGSDGARACEHFSRYREDIALMRELGVRSYRFSIGWTRVLPSGSGPVNEAGLAFYDRLVDALLAAGIEPFATLNHWDQPQALMPAGGWAARDSVDRFVEYADATSRRLGDRVKRWATHNEPWCIAILGYENGMHAPGLKEPRKALAAAHHLLLSHGRSVPVLRSNVKGGEIGLVVNLVPAHPASPSEADRTAARELDGSFNRWFLDPVFKGSYPADAIDDRVALGHLDSADLPFVHAGDLAQIQAPIDFLGINYYSRGILRSTRVPETENAPRTIPAPPPEAMTDMGWEVYPDGLREILVRVHQDYAVKRLYVTENGCAYSDGPDSSGRVADVRRREYLRGHLLACKRALDEGVPLGGYYQWSLLDNFEWQFGYSKRFGIVWVDFETQQRIVKDSGLWYRDVIVANAVDDEDTRERALRSA